MSSPIISLSSLSKALKALKNGRCRLAEIWNFVPPHRHGSDRRQTGAEFQVAQPSIKSSFSRITN
jgi:hypothetical protein